MRAGGHGIGAVGMTKKMIDDLVIVVDTVPEVLPDRVRVRLTTRDPADILMSGDIDHEGHHLLTGRDLVVPLLPILATEHTSGSPDRSPAHRIASQRSHPVDETIADDLRTDIEVRAEIWAGPLQLHLLPPMRMLKERLDWQPCSRMRMS